MEIKLTENQARAHFNKIILLNQIATEIALFGQNMGMKDFVQILDMTCGAIPEENFENVIDPNATEQFLQLYTQIVQNRFAFSVINVSSARKDFFGIIKNFCEQVGKANAISELQNVSQALEVFDSYILNGMTQSQNRIFKNQDENQIIWKDSFLTHQEAWKKFGGDFSLFLELLKIFVNEIINPSGIEFIISTESNDENYFILQKTK